MRDFRMFFFKVWNWHCTYIEFPNWQNALIDVKITDETPYENVLNILLEADIKKLNYLIITHPHQDHIWWLSKIVQNIEIDEFIYSPIYFKPNPTYNDWHIYEEMKKWNYCKKQFAVKKWWYTPIDDCRIDYLAPIDYLLNTQYDNVNNNWLLLKITCRWHSIIIPWDIEKDAWEYIDNNDIKDTTLLLASHHWNNSWYHLEKIKSMNLAFVVISTWPKTEYDADQKYRNQVRKNVYTTRTKRVVVKIDNENTLHVID